MSLQRPNTNSKSDTETKTTMMNHHLKRTKRLENKPNEIPSPVTMQKSVSFSSNSLRSFSSNTSTDNQNATFEVSAGGAKEAGVGAVRAEPGPRRHSSLRRSAESESEPPLSGRTLQRRSIARSMNNLENALLNVRTNGKAKHSDEEESPTLSSSLPTASPMPGTIHRRPSLNQQLSNRELRRRSSITGCSDDLQSINQDPDIENSDRRRSSMDTAGPVNRPMSGTIHRRPSLNQQLSNRELRRRSSITGCSDDLHQDPDIENSDRRRSSMDTAGPFSRRSSMDTAGAIRRGHSKRALITAFAKDLLQTTLQTPHSEVPDACLQEQEEELKKRVPSSPYKNDKPTDASSCRAVSPLSDIMKRFKCKSALYGFYLVTMAVAYTSFFRENAMQDHVYEMIKSHQEVQAAVASLNQSMEQNKNLVSNLHSEVSELYEANEDLKSASEQVDSDYKMQLRGVQLVQENDKITKTMDILISNNNNMADEMSVLIDKVQLESYRQVHER